MMAGFVLHLSPRQELPHVKPKLSRTECMSAGGAPPYDCPGRLGTVTGDFATLRAPSTLRNASRPPRRTTWREGLRERARLQWPDCRIGAGAMSGAYVVYRRLEVRRDRGLPGGRGQGARLRRVPRHASDRFRYAKSCSSPRRSGGRVHPVSTLCATAQGGGAQREQPCGRFLRSRF